MTALYIEAFTRLPISSSEPTLAALLGVSQSVRASFSPNIATFIPGGISENVFKILATSKGTFALALRLELLIGTETGLELIGKLPETNPELRKLAIKENMRSTVSSFSSSTEGAVYVTPAERRRFSPKPQMQPRHLAPLIVVRDEKGVPVSSVPVPVVVVGSSSSSVPSMTAAGSSGPDDAATATTAAAAAAAWADKMFALPTLPSTEEKTTTTETTMHHRAAVGLKHLERFSLSYGRGDFDCSHIFKIAKSSVLRELELTACQQLTGVPDFSLLPQTLEILTLTRNNLGGGCPDFTKLPKRLRILDISSNKLTGNPDLSSLPQYLSELRLNSNWFSGTPPLNLEYHERIKIMALHENNFRNPSGTRVDFSKLPHGLRQLSLQRNDLEGPLDLTAVPPSLEKIFVYSNRFSGSIDLAHFPANSKLQNINVENNNLTGAVCLSKLPESLVHLTLSRNRFIGLPDLTKLPKGLKLLNIGSNRFSCAAPAPAPAPVVPAPVVPAAMATTENENETTSRSDDHDGDEIDKKNLVLDLTQLPDSLEDLLIHQNHFDCPLDLSSLPKNLMHFSAYENSFCGELDLSQISATSTKLLQINLSSNCFTGKPILKNLPKSLQSIHLSKNRFCGCDPDLLVHLNEGLDTLYINKNRLLTGALDLTKLPKSLRKLDLSNCGFVCNNNSKNENENDGGADFFDLPPGLLFVGLSEGQKKGKCEDWNFDRLPNVFRQMPSTSIVRADEALEPKGDQSSSDESEG